MRSKPPEVPLEEWRKLYEAAVAFRNLAPWEWMEDAQLFGVQHPDTEEIAYCCIMGALGEFRALAAYIGPEGLSGYRDIQMGRIEPGDMRALWIQKCLMASFCDRREIDRNDYRIIRALGLRFRGSGQWPQFRWYEPGFPPWYLDTAQVQFLTLILHQAMEVAERTRADKAHLRPRRGRYLVRSLQGGEWRDTYVVPEPWQPEPIRVELDERQLVRLQEAQLPYQGTWEVECDYFPTPIDEGTGRPYYPCGCMVVDSRSGLILGMEVMQRAEVGRKVPKMLMNLWQRVGCLPRRVRVQREEMEQLLQPLASTLGFRLSRVRSLRSLNEAWMSLIGHLG